MARLLCGPRHQQERYAVVDLDREHGTGVGLNLMELANVALPMLCVLSMQLVVMVLFAVWITWRIMGRNYETALMSAGMCGFGIGNTANAVASMKSLVEAYRPAPRAFLVVPLVGTLLGDLTNAVIVTYFLNVLI